MPMSFSSNYVSGKYETLMTYFDPPLSEVGSGKWRFQIPDPPINNRLPMANDENLNLSQGRGTPSTPTTSQSHQSKPDSESVKQDTNRRLHEKLMHPQLRSQPNQKSMTNHSKKLRPHERIKSMTTNFDEMFNPKSFTKFFFIQASSEEQNLSNISVIKANRELIKCLGGTKPKKVDELRNGSLLIEVASEKQTEQLRNLKQLDDIPVSVKEHPYLNQVKGTIYYRNRCNYSEKEILEELDQFKVTNVYRTNKKVNYETIPNNIYILTFNCNTLPEEISIGWNKCRVRQYVPRPRRCFKCQGFQHSSKNCRREIGSCVNCGQEEHGTSCDRPPSCRNCNEPHPASSKNCFYYKLSEEIISLQTKEKMNYRDARQKALQYMTKPDLQYSKVTAKNLAELTNDLNDKPPSIIITNNDKKRLNSESETEDNNSQSKKKKSLETNKQNKTIESPVSSKSQETAQRSEPSTSSNLLRDAPHMARRAAVVASKQLGKESSAVPMEDDSQPKIPKANKNSRSKSRNRGKSPSS